MQQIYAAIDGATLDDEQGGYVYPSDATVPTVQFAVGDSLFTVNPEDFAFGDAGNGMTFGGVSRFSLSQVLYAHALLKIHSRGSNPFDILGDVFLKSVYVVFDQSNTQIGMAQRSSSSS